jgi:hypothetical protein
VCDGELAARDFQETQVINEGRHSEEERVKSFLCLFAKQTELKEPNTPLKNDLDPYEN